MASYPPPCQFNLTALYSYIYPFPTHSHHHPKEPLITTLLLLLLLLFLLPQALMAIGTQFHVLAVDDSLIDRKLIEKILKTSSFQVTVADSGSKALELLGLMENEEDDETFSDSESKSGSHELAVNLIITDYSMPGMTGYDLLRKIKESKSLKCIPVVIMSSENIPSRISRCLEEGAEEFLLKPVRLSDVDRIRPHLLKNQ